MISAHHCSRCLSFVAAARTSEGGRRPRQEKQILNWWYILDAARHPSQPADKITAWLYNTTFLWLFDSKDWFLKKCGCSFQTASLQTSLQTSRVVAKKKLCCWTFLLLLLTDERVDPEYTDWCLGCLDSSNMKQHPPPGSASYLSQHIYTHGPHILILTRSRRCCCTVNSSFSSPQSQ